MSTERTTHDRSTTGGFDAAPPPDEAAALAYSPPSSSRTTVHATARVQIALLRARVAALEAEVAERERQRQAIVDRYERVLEARDEGPAEEGTTWSVLGRPLSSLVP